MILLFVQVCKQPVGGKTAIQSTSDSKGAIFLFCLWKEGGAVLIESKH